MAAGVDDVSISWKDDAADHFQEEDDEVELGIFSEILLDEAVSVVAVSPDAVAAEVDELVAAAQPAVSAGKSRVGNSIYNGAQLMGTISYLLHWQPESFSARCKVHDNCYVTAPISTMDEVLLENWLSVGSRYSSAESHISARPEGSYNRRVRRH